VKTFVKGLVFLGICGVLLGCVHVPSPSFPPPIYPCPTQEDVVRLAELLAHPVDPIEAIELDALASRFIGSAAYCQTAEVHLR